MLIITLISLIIIFNPCTFYTDLIYKSVKQNRVLLEIIVATAEVISIICYFTDIHEYLYDEFYEIYSIYEMIVINGVLPTALFILVMMIGVLPGAFGISRFKSIRAELSIFASISLVPHILIFTYKYLQSPKFDMISVFLLITANLAFIIVIPLWITSYTMVRKRMSTTNWKRLQKLAYIVYGLIFLHGTLISIFIKHSFKDTLIYIILSMAYLFLKYYKTLHKKLNANINR